MQPTLYEYTMGSARSRGKGCMFQSVNATARPTERCPDPPQHGGCLTNQDGSEDGSRRRAKALIDQQGDCPGADEQPEDINISHP